MMQKSLKVKLKPWQIGTHLRVPSDSFLMNTNLTGFIWFSKIFAPLYFGRKKPQHWKGLSISPEIIVWNCDNFGNYLGIEKDFIR